MTSQERWLLAIVVVLSDLVAVFVPLAALLAAYVILVRPLWFRDGVAKLYSEPPEGD